MSAHSAYPVRNPVQRMLPLLIALAGGVGLGMILVFFGTSASPKIAVALVLAVPVVVAVMLNPTIGFYLTVLVIPMERLGRFTDDQSAHTISLMRFVGMLALGSLLLNALAGRWRLRVGFPLVLYTGYFLLGVISVTHSSDFLGTVRACGAVFGNILFFFLVINLAQSWERARKAVILWLVISVILGLYTMYDWHLARHVVDESTLGSTATRFSTAWNDTSEAGVLGRAGRARGPTSHAAVYGMNLILTLPFFFYFLFREPMGPRMRILVVASLGVILYNILLTNTRAVILLAGFLVLLCFLRRLAFIRPSILIALCLIVLLCIPFIPDSVKMRVMDIRNYTFSRSQTMSIRVEFWKIGLGLARENWAAGMGLGNELEIPARLTVTGPERTTVHNEYLMTFMELGIAGWLLFFGFVFSIVTASFRTASRLLRSSGETWRYWFMIACQLTLVSALLFGLQVDVFHFPLKGWWLIAALTFVLHGLAKAEAPAVTPLPVTLPKKGTATA